MNISSLTNLGQIEQDLAQSFIELKIDQLNLEQKLEEINVKKSKIADYLKGSIDLNKLTAEADYRYFNLAEDAALKTQDSSLKQIEMVKESPQLSSLESAPEPQLGGINKAIKLAIKYLLGRVTEASTEYLAKKLDLDLDYIENFLETYRQKAWFFNPNNTTWYVADSVAPKATLSEQSDPDLKTLMESKFNNAAPTQLEIEAPKETSEPIEAATAVDYGEMQAAARKKNPNAFKATYPLNAKVIKFNSIGSLIESVLKDNYPNSLNKNQVINCIYSQAEQKSFDRYQINLLRTKVISCLSNGVSIRTKNWTTPRTGSGLYVYHKKS